MPRTREPYPPEFRQQMIELVKAGRTPESLESLVQTCPPYGVNSTLSELSLSLVDIELLPPPRAGSPPFRGGGIPARAPPRDARRTAHNVGEVSRLISFFAGGYHRH
jgi:hypothetical protein